MTRRSWFASLTAILPAKAGPIVPGSLSAVATTQEKLLCLKLARNGYIDPWTLIEKLGIPSPLKDSP